MSNPRAAICHVDAGVHGKSYFGNCNGAKITYTVNLSSLGNDKHLELRFELLFTFSLKNRYPPLGFRRAHRLPTWILSIY